MELNPETMSQLADMIVVVTFFSLVMIAYSWILFEFVSAVVDTIRNLFKKLKKKRDPDGNQIAEH